MISTQDKLSLELLNFSLNYFGIIHQHPLRSSKIKRIISTIIFFSDFFFLLILNIKLYFIMGFDVVQITKAMSSLGTIVLAGIKIFPFIYYQDRIIDLMYRRKYFWQASPGVTKIVEDTYRNYLFVSKTFGISVYAVAGIFCIQPFFSKELIIPVYVPDIKHAFIFINLTQYLYAVMTVSLVIAFNALYLSFFADVLVQFKVLNDVLANIKYEDPDASLKLLKKCIMQHKFLLKYVFDAQGIFLVPLLALYIVTVSTSCMQCFSVTEPSSTLLEKILGIIYVMTLYYQMYLFCIPTSELTHEVVALSDALYFSEWYNATPEIKKIICITIQKAQQELEFKALDLVVMNNMVLINVVKATFSFLTLFKNFGDK